MRTVKNNYVIYNFIPFEDAEWRINGIDPLTLSEKQCRSLYNDQGPKGEKSDDKTECDIQRFDSLSEFEKSWNIDPLLIKESKSIMRIFINHLPIVRCTKGREEIG